MCELVFSEFQGIHKYRLNINGTWQLDTTKEISADNKFNILRVTSSELAGEEFAQHEPLTTRLRNILRQYPGMTLCSLNTNFLDGGQILKELLQNGDDASAKYKKSPFLFLHYFLETFASYLTCELTKANRSSPSLFALSKVPHLSPTTLEFSKKKISTLFAVWAPLENTQT